jgi:tetratricopeptide (TPR) repeat protein
MIGQLADGYEASFIALKENPLQNFEAVRTVTLRFKQGHILTVENPQFAAKRPSIIDSVHAIMAVKGVDSALAAYRKLRDDTLFSSRLNEFQLNTLGYALLTNGMTDQAGKVFELNLEYYPRSANAWDSYADYLGKLHRDADVLAANRKLLECLPECKYYTPELYKQIEESAKARQSGPTNSSQ